MRWIHLVVVVVVVVHCEQLLGVILSENGQPISLLHSWEFMGEILLTDGDIIPSGSPPNCQFEQIQGPETSLQNKLCYTGEDCRVVGALASLTEDFQHWGKFINSAKSLSHDKLDQEWLAQLPLEALVETDAKLLTQRKPRDDYLTLIKAIDLLDKFQIFASHLQPPDNNLPAKSVRRGMRSLKQLFIPILANSQNILSPSRKLEALHNKYQELLTIVHEMGEAQYKGLPNYVEDKDNLTYVGSHLIQLRNKWLNRKAKLEKEHSLASAMKIEWVSYIKMTNEQKFIKFPLLYTLNRMDWSQFKPIFLYIAGCLVKARDPIDEWATNNGLSLLLRQIIPILLITQLFSQGFEEASAILDSLDKIPALAEGLEDNAIDMWKPAYMKFINFLAPQFNKQGNPMAVQSTLSPKSQMAFEYLCGLNGAVYTIEQGKHGYLPTLHLAIPQQSYQNKEAWANLLQCQNSERKHQ
ncbi:hypothetical protein IWQ61_002228 [Dispira simplex]|nr:hypothetical protein IWQ61_002228 [Dispira simplex]